MTKMVTFKFGEIVAEVEENLVGEFEYFAEKALDELDNTGIYRKPLEALYMQHIYEALISHIDHLQNERDHFLEELKDEIDSGEIETDLTPEEFHEGMIDYHRSLEPAFLAATKKEMQQRWGGVLTIS